MGKTSWTVRDWYIDAIKSRRGDSELLKHQPESSVRGLLDRQSAAAIGKGPRPGQSWSQIELTCQVLNRSVFEVIDFFNEDYANFKRVEQLKAHCLKLWRLNPEKNWRYELGKVNCEHWKQILAAWMLDFPDSYLNREQSGEVKPEQKLLAKWLNFASTRFDSSGIFKIRLPRGPSMNVAYSENGWPVLIQNDGSVVLAWRLESDGLFSFLGEFRGHEHDVLCSTITSNGSQLVTGGRDGQVWSWELDSVTGKRLNRTTTGWITSVCATSDGNYIAAAAGNSIFIWRPPFDNVFHIQHCSNRAEALSLAFSNNGSFLFAGCNDRVLRRWANFGHAEEEKCTKGFEPIVRVNCTPGGDGAAFLSKGSMIDFWGTYPRLSGNNKVTKVTAIAASRRFQFFGCGDEIGNVHIWDLQRNVSVFSEGFKGPIRAIDFMDNECSQAITIDDDHLSVCKLG